MESKYGSRRKPSSLRGILLATLASFIAGGLLAGYIVWYNYNPTASREPAVKPSATGSVLTQTPAPTAAVSPTPRTEPLKPIDPANAEEAVKTVAEAQGGIDQRLEAAEQRLAALALRSEEAEGNAARLEALLIAFAARRLIERGDELGDLTQQLRLRFGDERPNAVSTIINFSRRDTPLRLDTLVARLDGLGPELTRDDAGPSWDMFVRELRSLFVIRRQSTPSPQADFRLARARQALEQGRLESAIREIKGMPGAPKAAEWIADAEEYMLVMEALENIETAAVLAQSGSREERAEAVEAARRR
jgi:hypothetical protein